MLMEFRFIDSIRYLVWDCVSVNDCWILLDNAAISMNSFGVYKDSLQFFVDNELF